MRKTVARIDFDGLLKQSRGLRGAVWILPGQRVALQNTLIGFQAGRWLPPRAFGVGDLDTAHERTDDRLNNLVLNSEKFRQIPIKFLGPDMAAAPGVDQLCVDPDARPYPPHAAFEDIANIQFTSDLLHVDCDATIPERG